MKPYTPAVAAVGRILIALIFVLSGISKLGAPAATQDFIASVGLPVPMLSYAAATAVELLGGLLLIVGFQTRITAVIVAVFTLATALVFHNNFADQNQMIHFLKNIAMVGGLLQIVAFGAGSFSIDARRGSNSTAPSPDVRGVARTA